jgi:carboxylate-amine ligase
VRISIPFAKSKPLTLGVELELQLIDPETFDLKPCSSLILQEMGPEVIAKPELFQSMVEINTSVCVDANEIGLELTNAKASLLKAAQAVGAMVCGGGTHPFANYRERRLYPNIRYQRLIAENQWIARRLQIFGLHIHVGMRDRDHAIHMNNALLHFSPLFLALSASSPFCEGEDTRLASARTTFFESSSRGGHPCLMENWEDFEKIVDGMVRSKSIVDANDIWWDIRPSPKYGTIEIRICDAPTNIEDVEALVALIHCLCISIDSQIRAGRKFSPPPMWVMRENKWRACRYGLESSFVLDARGATCSLRIALQQLLQQLQPLALANGYETQFENLANWCTDGASYARLRDVFYMTGDLKSVVQHLVEEFRRGKSSRITSIAQGTY